LDALFQPYIGVWHDAQLYAVQVLNRLEAGRFNNDLFFLHGSQDSYSLFSLVMAPLARCLGLLPSFFLVYLAGRAVFLFAAARLFRALIPNGRAAVIALIFLAINQVPYGGVSAFHVNERFLTPRLVASGLVLFGLEQMLARRFFTALGLLVAATLLHPLIACGGLLVFAFWYSCQVLSPRLLVTGTLTTGLAAVGVLLYQPLGLKLFGVMDDQWRDLIMRRSPHCFPMAWMTLDWLQIGSSFFVIVAAARHLQGPAAIFCRALAIAGLLGLAGAFLAADLPYALLLQGQPFRVLWLVQLLAIPLGFFLGFSWATDPRTTPRLLAIFLWMALVYQFDFDARTVVLLFVPFPVFVWWYLGSSSGRTCHWLALSLLSSIVVGVCLKSVLTAVSLAALWPDLASELEPLHLAAAVTAMFDHGLLLLGCTVPASAVWLLSRACMRLAPALVLAGVAYQGLHFGLSRSESYCRTYRKDYENMRFVQEFLANAPAAERTPTVYWVTDVKYLWLHLGVNCYFHLVQTPNSIFSRGEAIEGDRRAQLVAGFEIQKLRSLRVPGKELMSKREWRLLLANFCARGDEPPPQREDLLRLCQEEGLDYIISDSFLGPGYRACNGKVYVYETRTAAQARAGRTPGPRQ
jgi:hypothetical protein